MLLVSIIRITCEKHITKRIFHTEQTKYMTVQYIQNGPWKSEVVYKNQAACIILKGNYTHIPTKIRRDIHIHIEQNRINKFSTYCTKTVTLANNTNVGRHLCLTFKPWFRALLPYFSRLLGFRVVFVVGELYYSAANQAISETFSRKVLQPRSSDVIFSEL